MNKQESRTLEYLKGKNKILFLTTSNRWEKHEDYPKSTALAYKWALELGKDKVTVIDIPKLNIHPCEGNVSAKGGNNCGVKDAALPDKLKNPTGQLRCWASYNNSDDELYKVANCIFDSDTVVFFGSIRWGQANSFYQKLIERLCWLENRWTALKEENILKGKDAGFVFVGQNWNGENVVKTQKQVLKFYGFNTPEELFWNWQYTQDANDESLASYKKAITTFESVFNIVMNTFIYKFKRLYNYFK
jgi:multimeric flavodoxin WrbA